ncbi:unnamed protein product [Cochlearia groenlandica]
MEEVWKEINLNSTIHQHHHHHHVSINNHEPKLKNQNHNNSIFQDFFKMPMNQEPTQPSYTSLNQETSRFGCFVKKRNQEVDESKGERRHKRMIKNRESAARSRARKQECISLSLYSFAYTNELELEIVHLQKENARLKRQEEQLKLVETSQHQTKKTLQRSSTSPF